MKYEILACQAFFERPHLALHTTWEHLLFEESHIVLQLQIGAHERTQGLGFHPNLQGLPFNSVLQTWGSD